MKDERELLDRVNRTLRERNDGREPPNAATRERILASVRKQHKRRTWWLKGSIPGGMLLLGTTAWAQATHQWPAVWRTLGDILSLPLSSEGSGEQELALARTAVSQSQSTRHSPSAAPDTVDDISVRAADAGVAFDVTADTPPQASRATGEFTELPTLGSSLRRKKAPPTQRNDDQTAEPLPNPEPVEPPSEPEIAAFRAANDLDIKQRNLTAALSSYRLYIRDYPAGRFVPEARYNAAIILVKLGKRDEARKELTPFASGKYGAHRQARAAKLLEALEQAGSNPEKPH